MIVGGYIGLVTAILAVLTSAKVIITHGMKGGEAAKA